MEEVVGAMLAITGVENATTLWALDSQLVFDLGGGDNFSVVKCSERHSHTYRNTSVD
ncbi:hypothetical protein [Haladaptatus sp. NG-WS-4]